jgi:hypothetical protein
MQKTETIVEERPQRAVRVVPIEPSLLNRYYYLISSAIVLLILIVNLSVALNEVLLSRSFIGIWSLYYVIMSVLFSFPFKPWKALNQRRQQAARYNLTTGVLIQAGSQSRSEVPDLPDSFAIYAQRRWLSTCIIAFISVFAMCFMCIVTYTYTQYMLQEVQYGISMGVVIWEISLNSATILVLIGLIFTSLVISPRQQIIASRDGLVCRRGYRTSYIPWQQARLFAIIGQATISKQKSILFYELASNDSIIRWPSASRFVNQGIGSKVPSAVTLLRNIQTRAAGSDAEFQQQVQFLNIIIAERTGLPLYDLS